MSQCQCLVGYALNKKKLRKSEAEEGRGEGRGGSVTSQVWRGGGLANLLCDISTEVKFQAVDFEQPQEQQPSFHVILHKLTEDIRSTDGESQAKLQFLSEYVKRNPQTVIVDPVEAVKHVISRQKVCQVLERIISMHAPAGALICSDGGDNSQSFHKKEGDCSSTKKQKTAMTQPSSNRCCPFSQPNYLIVEEVSQITKLFEASGLIFPVICKPIEACGTPTSHSMVVAVDVDGLLMVKEPSVIQEYKDHDGSFFKIYVIDNEVMVYQRPSLPNLEALLRQENTSGEGDQLGDFRLKSILFDSRYAYPTERSFFEAPLPVPPPSSSTEGNNSVLMTVHTEEPFSDRFETFVRQRKPSAADLSDPNERNHQAQFEEIAAALGKEFGLTLFGFDCIIPSPPRAAPVCSHAHVHNLSDIVIIDVNFFPSYKEVQDFPTKLRSYLRRRAGFL